MKKASKIYMSERERDEMFNKEEMECGKLGETWRGEDLCVNVKREVEVKVWGEEQECRKNLGSAWNKLINVHKQQ